MMAHTWPTKISLERIRDEHLLRSRAPVRHGSMAHHNLLGYAEYLAPVATTIVL